MRDWPPEDHLAWFVLDVVAALDTGAFHAGRRVGGAGAAGYDPDMLLALLIYAYCQGVRSSRQIEARCAGDVAFRVLCAQDAPDHATIARFRAESQGAFESLFTQVLLVAAPAGMARLGTVAVDGTKIAASASLDANRGRDWLERQVSQIVAEAAGADAAEDAAGDGGGPGDRLPRHLASRARRAARLRQAAAEVAAQEQQREQDARRREEAALARRQRSEAGEPVRGRIPGGPHHLAEARAHLAREIAVHQAKLDRHAGLIAAGKKPMGRPPVPMDQSSRVLRARRVVQAAEQAAAAPPAGPPRPAGSRHRRPGHLPA